MLLLISTAILSFVICDFITIFQACLTLGPESQDHNWCSPTWHSDHSFNETVLSVVKSVLNKDGPVDARQELM